MAQMDLSIAAFPRDSHTHKRKNLEESGVLRSLKDLHYTPSGIQHGTGTKGAKKQTQLSKVTQLSGLYSVRSPVFQLIISSFPHSFSDKIKLNNQAFFNVCCHLNKTINGRKSAAAELSPSPQFLQNYHLILDICSHFLMSNLCTS